MNQIYFTADLLPTSALGFTNGILKEKCYTNVLKSPLTCAMVASVGYS
jgi:hypothetical protein